MNPRQNWEPPADDPVRLRGSDKVNLRIDRETRGAIELASHAPYAIRARLAELDKEWHLDRALMALFSVLGGLTASKMVRNVRRKGWIGGTGLLFWTQIGFLMNHAIRGWCPPVPLLRRLGFRTAREISAERVALEKKLVAEDGG